MVYFSEIIKIHSMCQFYIYYNLINFIMERGKSDFSDKSALVKEWGYKEDLNYPIQSFITRTLVLS